MACNLTQAAAPLMAAFGADRAAAGDFAPTPYQTADARHVYARAAALVRGYYA